MSLFAHIAPRFARSSEDLATEGLAHILSSSNVAAAAFGAHLSALVAPLGVEVSGRFEFETRRGMADGGGIPDLRAHALDSPQEVLIESKFWAGLTDNQPRGYVQALGRSEKPETCILLFLVPEARLPSLWREIMRLLKQEELLESAVTDAKLRLGVSPASPCPVRTRQGPIVGIVSWGDLLSYLEEGLRRSGASHCAADGMDTATLNVAVSQRSKAYGRSNTLRDLMDLRSLCDRMIGTAEWVPASSEDLTGNRFPRLIGGLVQLIDLLVERSDPHPPGKPSGRPGYCRPIELGSTNCAVALDFSLWAKHGLTPLWLHVHAGSVRHRVHLEEGLKEEEIEGVTPYYDKGLAVPLHLPPNEDRDIVLRHLQEQLVQLDKAIKPHAWQLFSKQDE